MNKRSDVHPLCCLYNTCVYKFMYPVIPFESHRKMWKVLLLLVAAVAVPGYENAATSCKVLLHKECDIENQLPEDLPGTKEELENVCSHALGFFVCANRILENCNKDIELTSHFELERNVKRICDKDYVFYDALIESLPCLKSNRLLITSCPGLQGERMENFVKSLADIGIVDVTAPDTEPIRCLNTVFSLGCYVSNTGKVCSSEAKDILLDIIQGFDDTFSYCRPGIKEYLRNISEVIDTNTEQGAHTNGEDLIDYE